jgi:hypothetical protein
MRATKRRRDVSNALASRFAIISAGVSHSSTVVRRQHASQWSLFCYLTATLRPGLSPADCRLLFNHALVALNLPLPAAIRRPVAAFD